MNLIAQIEAEQIAALGKTIPDFKAGDTIRVGYKVTEGTRSRVQAYEGVCIARKNGKGIAGSFTVRKISFGEGVERVFPLHSTNIDSIEVVRRGKVRRAKLYYLRGLRGKSARIVEKQDNRERKRSRPLRASNRAALDDFVKSAAHRRAFVCGSGFGSAYFCVSGPFMIQRWPKGSRTIAVRVPQNE